MCDHFISYIEWGKSRLTVTKQSLFCIIILQPFGSHASAQSTDPHQPGLSITLAVESTVGSFQQPFTLNIHTHTLKRSPL